MVDVESWRKDISAWVMDSASRGVEREGGGGFSLILEARDVRVSVSNEAALEL